MTSPQPPYPSKRFVERATVLPILREVGVEARLMSTTERNDLIEEHELPAGNVDGVIGLSFQCPCTECGGTLIGYCPECNDNKQPKVS